MKSFLNGLKKVCAPPPHKGLEDSDTYCHAVMLCAPARNYVFLGIHSKK